MNAIRSANAGQGCPVELQPMAEWVKQGKPEECRPCLLGPVVQWYHSELKETEHESLASELEKVADQTDVDAPEQVLTLCQKLDIIKDTVEESLRERLKDFDCACQSFNPDAAVEQQEQH